MGLSGLFLVSFLFVHVGGNALLFIPDDGESFNEFVQFMTSNPLIKALELVLAAGFIIHIVYGIVLTLRNNQARPQKYVFNKAKDKGSSWVSRNMIGTGTIVLVFLAIHIVMFYGRYHYGPGGPVSLSTAQVYSYQVSEEFEVEGYVFPKKSYIEVEDIALLKAAGVNVDEVEITALSMTEVVKESFRNPLIVGFYVIAVIMLALHLAHGFQSAFRTLGLVHGKYMPLIITLGYGIGIVIPTLFALMPIVIFFREVVMA